MSKRMLAVIVLLVALLAGTLGHNFYKIHEAIKKMSGFKMPPSVVATIKAQSVTWQPKLYAVGTLKAVDGVDVSSQVAGQVIAITFKSGQQVTKGQPLIQLDDSFDRAQLHNDQAALKLAKVEFSRQRELFLTRATARQSVDEARAKLEQAMAMVKADKVTISRKAIKAPFSGKIGICQVNIGQYVQAGSALVNLQSLNPLHIDFYLPEQDLKSVYVNQPVNIDIEAYPKQTFKAHVTAINSTVDVDTRTFHVQAQVPNDNHKLYPGVFANAYVILPQQQNVITVPQTAITYTLYGDSVYLIQKKTDKDGKPELIAKRHSVELGDQRGTVVVIKSGLNAGDEIVNAGQLKLQDNSPVIINNKMMLEQGA